MQVNSGTTTITEEARRAQIVAATIDTLGELGYAKTSFARIVERARLSSTRLISYHFDGKSDLMLATLTTVIGAMDDFLAKRLGSASDRAAMLRTSIEAEIAFLGARPMYYRALTEIGRNARDDQGTPLFELVWTDFRVGRLSRQLRQGQREGAFGDFDVDTLAMAVRQAVDGVADRLACEPDLDVDACGRELARLFDRATRPIT